MDRKEKIIMSTDKVNAYSKKAQYVRKTDGKTADKLHKQYTKKQQDLSNQIIDPPRNVEDLRHNARIEKQKIDLAVSSGDDKILPQLQKN